MIDFTPVFRGETTFGEFCAVWTKDDLRALTNNSIDALLAEIADCTDADVNFVASDPEAEGGIGWTIGHVVAHTTASGEESAFLAAELARGVPSDGGRSRYEMQGKLLNTIAKCRQRLEESRHMRLTCLDVWPAEPHLDNVSELSFLPGPINAVARFALGLMHDQMHPPHLQEIARQAKAARA